MQNSGNGSEFPNFFKHGLLYRINGKRKRSFKRALAVTFLASNFKYPARPLTACGRWITKITGIRTNFLNQGSIHRQKYKSGTKYFRQNFSTMRWPADYHIPALSRTISNHLTLVTEMERACIRNGRPPSKKCTEVLSLWKKPGGFGRNSLIKGLEFSDGDTFQHHPSEFRFQ